MSPQTASNSDTEPGAAEDAGCLRSIKNDRGDWRILAHWRERVLGPGSPDWFAMSEDPRATCVKEGADRTVWRVDLEEGVVYAKVFGSGGLSGTAKRWIVGDPAGRELGSARQAERAGVGVIRFVAAGTARKPRGISVLLSEGICDAVTLIDAWHESVEGVSGAARRRAVARLAEPVARLYAQAHDRGFVDLDGHPNNVLVFGDVSERLQAVFVDLHAAKFSNSSASLKRVAIALGQLEHVFRRVASRSERFRFLRRYLDLRGMAPSRLSDKDLRRLIRAVLTARERQARRLARKRDGRLRRDGKYFAAIRLRDGWTAKVTLAMERRHLFAELSVPDRTRDDWLGLLNAAIAKSCTHGSPADVAAPGVRCLAHRAGSLLSRIGWTIGGSPARAAFERCHRLRHRDIAAPLVLGYAERRRGGLVDAAIGILPRDPQLEALAEAPTDPRFAESRDGSPDGGQK